MTEATLTDLIQICGFAQLSALIASAQVPVRLGWHRELAALPRLLRQLHWIYAGYVVLSILAFGLLSILFAGDLAAGSPLARALCAYVALFWGIRLGLQAVLDAGPYLKTRALRLGYHLLTLLFAVTTALYAFAAVHPVA